jgi:hypothetical protein
MAPPANANEVGSTGESLAIETRRVRLPHPPRQASKTNLETNYKTTLKKQNTRRREAFGLQTLRKRLTNRRFPFTARVL